MKIISQTSVENSDQSSVFSSGKIRISWSQTRGGFAIFVSGRMEGPLFDYESEASDYLQSLGISNYKRK